MSGAGPAADGAAAAARPQLGRARTIRGVACRSFTFAADDPALPGRPAALHLTGWSDPPHGEPIVLPAYPGDGHRAGLSITLPEDIICSYRYLLDDVGAGDPHDVGERPVRRPVPDPGNPLRLEHPRHGPSSVVLGPSAPTHAAWHPRSPAVVSREEHLLSLSGRRIRLLRDPREVDTGTRAPVCVVFDEAAWSRVGLARAMERYEPVVHVALVDTLDVSRRARDLTAVDRAQIVLAGVVDVVGRCLGRSLPPEEVIVAGQSYGGLGAALLVSCRPDLAGAAIAQSASFWYRRGMTPGMPRTEPGDLVSHLRDRRGASGLTGLCGRARAGRIVVQVGTDERGQVAHARAFRDAARAAGLGIEYREVRGGHDYAWWAHGLLHALDILLDDRAR